MITHPPKAPNSFREVGQRSAIERAAWPIPGPQAKYSCGARVWRRTIVVYVLDRASLPAQSASQRVYFVGRFRSGTTSGRSCIRTGAEQRRLASVLSPKAARYRPPQSTPFNRSASQIAPAPPEGETGAIWGASASKKIRARLPPLTPAWRTALVKARSPRHPLAQSAHEQLVGALAPRASAADRA